MKGKELQGRLSRVMKVEVDMATIFCVECGESNNIDRNECMRCNKILSTENEDYCCLCGCEQ